MITKTAYLVIGYKTLDNDCMINLESEAKLIKGSKLIILLRPEQLEKLKSLS